MSNKTINLLKKLIEIPSYVGEGVNESEIGNFVYDFLKKNTNLEVEKQFVEDKRFNIVAYKNPNPELMFFSHLDTVPPKNFKSNCTKPIEKDGKIFGLGSVDMKSGLAVSLSIANKFKNNDNIAYIFSVDEEYEFKGAKALVKKYKFKPKLIINPEPTSLQILNSCRGVTEFTLKFHGKSCHAGSKNLGINAIEKSVELFDILQKEISKYDNESGKNSLNLAGLNGGILRENNQVIGSGNLVPNYASCIAEIRISNRKLTKNFIENKINSISKKIGIEVSNIEFNFLMNPAFTPKSKLKNFENILKETNINPIYRDINNSGYYEVQFLQENWGSDILIFGPSPYEKSHQEEEYVEIKTINIVEKVFEDFINNYYTRKKI
ncbi:M20/M25/M40 family metallo-hydrolase [Patescibacteria group bacterium]|nr:M20/M25/M40 family metallo-hydrolase [Patescibacteria group bacterium]